MWGEPLQYLSFSSLSIFPLQDREQGRRADKVAVKKGVLLLKLLKLNLVARIFSPASDKDKEKDKEDRDWKEEALELSTYSTYGV